MIPAPPAGPITIAGKTVSRLGFGTMRLTGRGTWADPDDRLTALTVLRRAVHTHGISHIDTADASLRRLKVEQLELCYLHRIGPEVSRDDQIAVLHALRDAGPEQGGRSSLSLPLMRQRRLRDSGRELAHGRLPLPPAPDVPLDSAERCRAAWADPVTRPFVTITATRVPGRPCREQDPQDTPAPPMRPAPRQ
ncbi:hypothetical protein [Streptomyces sp. NPDC004538]|uniref:hypothetical protein n=1 Tax=Streptomyces sp. NPDC004538 TaxID=3154279 RepID=UPI0033AE324A